MRQRYKKEERERIIRKLDRYFSRLLEHIARGELNSQRFRETDSRLNHILFSGKYDKLLGDIEALRENYQELQGRMEGVKPDIIPESKVKEKALELMSRYWPVFDEGFSERGYAE